MFCPAGGVAAAREGGGQQRNRAARCSGPHLMHHSRGSRMMWTAPLLTGSDIFCTRLAGPGLSSTLCAHRYFVYKIIYFPYMTKNLNCLTHMWWHTTVIPAAWKAEAGESEVRGESEQLFKTLSKNKRARGIAQWWNTWPACAKPWVHSSVWQIYVYNTYKNTYTQTGRGGAHW